MKKLVGGFQGQDQEDTKGLDSRDFFEPEVSLETKENCFQSPPKGRSKCPKCTILPYYPSMVLWTMPGTHMQSSLSGSDWEGPISEWVARHRPWHDNCDSLTHIERLGFYPQTQCQSGRSLPTYSQGNLVRELGISPGRVTTGFSDQLP